MEVFQNALYRIAPKAAVFEKSLVRLFLEAFENSTGVSWRFPRLFLWEIQREEEKVRLEFGARRNIINLRLKSRGFGCIGIY
jgi:hypothetical protein